MLINAEELRKRTKNFALRYPKICIVSEEADESNFWLDFISDLKIVKEENQEDFSVLLEESEKLMKLFAKAKATTKNNRYLEEPISEYFF